MRKIYKYLLRFFVIVFIILIGIYIYGINSWRHLATESEIKNLVAEIKSAEEVPDKFYKFLNALYPNDLNNGITQTYIKSISNPPFRPSPSLLAAKYWGLPLQKKSDKRRMTTSFFGLAVKLEDDVTQKECINWIVSNYDFLENQIGISNASKFYYKKDISKLSDAEMATLALIFKNSSLYNPKRNPDGMKKLVSELLMKVE